MEDNSRNTDEDEHTQNDEEDSSKGNILVFEIHTVHRYCLQINGTVYK